MSQEIGRRLGGSVSLIAAYASLGGVLLIVLAILGYSGSPYATATTAFFVGVAFMIIGVMLIAVINFLRLVSALSANEATRSGLKSSADELIKSTRWRCRQVLGRLNDIANPDDLVRTNPQVRERLADLAKSDPSFSQDYNAVLVLLEKGVKFVKASGGEAVTIESAIVCLLVATELLNTASSILDEWEKPAERWERCRPPDSW